MSAPATATTSSPDTTADDDAYRKVRRLNLIMGTVHAVSATAMLVLSNDFSLPITATFMDGPPGSGSGTPEVLFNLPLGPSVAAFLILSAVAHFFVASPMGYPSYRRNLAKGINPYRWLEYAVSSSLMIVLIALLPGITDLTALVGLFAVNAGMILFGWMMELHNQSTRTTDWTAFIFGSILGAVPWLIISFQLVGSGSDVPSFVYAIFVTLFIFFNSFAINMVLQYRAKGRWADYLFGERVYIWLSITSKSALAWQVFANTLIPT